MKIRDIMTTRIFTIKETESVKDAVLKLRQHGISGMPVVDASGKLTGVFTETDLINLLPDILNDSDSIPLVDVKELTGGMVRDNMGSPPITVSPDDNIQTVAKIFLEHYIHRCPVVENDELIGIVSLGDVLKAFAS